MWAGSLQVSCSSSCFAGVHQRRHRRTAAPGVEPGSASRVARRAHRGDNRPKEPLAGGSVSMQIVIDTNDWQRLSAPVRQELLRLLGSEAATAPRGTAEQRGFRWRVPHDLTPGLAKKLLRGLSEDTINRLKLFARDGGRVRMRDLLAVTEDSDLHALSAFEGTVTRKLRRLVGDDNKIVSLIMWDYDAEQWDTEHRELVDGVFYVSPTTAQVLQRHFARS